MADASERKKPSWGAWRDALALVQPHRWRLLAGFGLLCVSRLAGLALPASSKYLVDEILGKGNAALLTPLAGAIMAATLLQAATSLALSRVLGLAAQRSILELRREMQAKVLRLPVSFFDSEKSGTLVSRIMSDPDALRNLLGTGLVALAGSLLTAVFALTALVWLNWRLTLMTLVFLTAFAFLLRAAFRVIRPLFRQRAELSSQLVGRLTESLAGIRVVKAYQAEGVETRVFGEGLERLFASVRREVSASAALGAAALVIFGGISASLVFAGGHAILSGTMTLGDFVMYVFFIGLLVSPMARIAETGTQLSEAFSGLDRMREIRERPSEDQDDAARETLPGLAGHVVFEDVSFEYAPGARVLDGISFAAPAGSTTALVGPSGAGKSTVIGLVMGFYRPTAGRVLVDGRDLAHLRIADYRRHLGVVPQESFLFEGTIRENIAYGKPGASDEEVRAAAKAAHCDEFADRLPQGFDTLVGERGVKLSGGQRQRVAIARAVLADPRVLILDEATSSLDSESEALVQDGLRSLREGRTTFVIAHRLSTVRSADQILVLDGGRVVERGSHEELLALGGRYRQLHDRQLLHQPRDADEDGTGPEGPPSDEAPKGFGPRLDPVYPPRL